MRVEATPPVIPAIMCSYFTCWRTLLAVLVGEVYVFTDVISNFVSALTATLWSAMAKIYDTRVSMVIRRLVITNRTEG